MTLTETEERVFSDTILDIMLDGDATDPFGRPCEAKKHKCPNTAAYLVRWKPAPHEPCHCGNQALCVSHKDQTIAFGGLSDPDTYFRCPACDGFVCFGGVTSLI